MDNSNYAIKTYEAVLMPIEDNKGKIWLRNCVWAIIGIIIIGSFIFDINIFKEISWTVRIFLIVLAIGFGFYGEKMTLIKVNLIATLNGMIRRCFMGKNTAINKN